MSRTVQCVKLEKEAPGLEYPPYPGEMGVRIWQSISQEAWEEWKAIQTRLVNEIRVRVSISKSKWKSFCLKAATLKHRVLCHLRRNRLSCQT